MESGPSWGDGYTGMTEGGRHRSHLPEQGQPTWSPTSVSHPDLPASRHRVLTPTYQAVTVRQRLRGLQGTWGRTRGCFLTQADIRAPPSRCPSSKAPRSQPAPQAPFPSGSVIPSLESTWQWPPAPHA